MNPAAWSVRNRVAANLLTLVILTIGFFLARFEIPRALFPDVAWDFVTISVLDRTNGLPEDMERLVTIPIEESLASVKNIKEITSISQPNFTSIFLKTEANADTQDVLNDVRQEVSRLRNRLPPSIEEPVIEVFDAPFPLFNLGVVLPPGVVAGDLRPALERLERQLRLVKGVSRVVIDGLPRREVWIEIDPVLAEAYGVSPAAVHAAVAAASDDAVAGRQRGDGGERLVRLLAEARQAEDFLDLAIPTQDGTGSVLLRDIAQVRDTAEEARTRARVNLRSGVSFGVLRQPGADARAVAEGVRAVIAETRPNLPEGADLIVLADATRPIDIRLRTVLTNGIQALTIIAVLLMVFLHWRLALIVAVGLPVSVAGVFIVLYAGGKTLDVLSLFALIMALGMLVDDAVVVAENVYRLYEKGLSPEQAAIQGTGEVLTPVLGSVATSVAAFLPLLLGQNIIGKFLFIVPVVVIAALAFSLLQAFFILPSHLADFVRHPPKRADLQQRLRDARKPLEKTALFSSLCYWDLRATVDALVDHVRSIYLYLLKISLRVRYLVVLLFGASAVFALALVAMGLIPFRLFDTDYADRAYIKLELPPNASLDQMEAAVAKVEQTVVDRLPPDDILSILTQVGKRLNESNEFELLGPNLAMLTIDLDDQNPKARSASVIARDLQNLAAELPDFVVAQAFKEDGGPPVGRPVNIILSGEDLDVLRGLANEVKRRLADVPGVSNLADNFTPGTPEWRFALDHEEAARRGFDARSASLLLALAYDGVEAARLRWGDDEVVVRVRLDSTAARETETLLGLRLTDARSGAVVPLSEITDLTVGSGLSRVFRRDQNRTITISADLDTRVTNSRAVNQLAATWMPEILDPHPGYNFRLAGENEDTAESLYSMLLASVLAFALIYTILAVLFNSFAQPLIVMAVIPFGIVGVILGLLIEGESMGLMSILGTIALAGIVVNNSVVFLDFINQFRRSHPLEESGDSNLRHFQFARWFSILDAGKVRLRPIFLTTVTTVAGLWGLAFFSSGQEEFLAPMAKALVWGLSFATLITLILIPCLYAILDDLALWRLRRRLRRSTRS